MQSSDQAEDMQARINRLESLVTTLVKQNQQLASDGNGAANNTSVDQITPFSSDGSDNGMTEEIQQGIGMHMPQYILDFIELFAPKNFSFFLISYISNLCIALETFELRS